MLPAYSHTLECRLRKMLMMARKIEGNVFLASEIFARLFDVGRSYDCCARSLNTEWTKIF